jgi:undecaprenyl diphosphate synthase
MDNDLPPIDILIRTGGEHRLSNFMLYELSYAEIFFLDTYFPDFTGDELDDVITKFYGADRRFGGINEKS